MVMVLKRNYHAKNTKFNEFLYLVILKLNGLSARQLKNLNQNYDFSQNIHVCLSFCFVSDLIEGLIKLMNSNYHYPLNLGNDQEISIFELANLIKSKIDEKTFITFRDLPFDDPKCRKPSLEKAKKLLNWNPKINLSEGLNKTISFYLDKSKK